MTMLPLILLLMIASAPSAGCPSRTTDDDDDDSAVDDDDDSGDDDDDDSSVWTAPPLDFPEGSPVLLTEGNSKSPSVAVHEGRVHIVWHDFTSDPPSLYHAFQEEPGGAFSAGPLDLYPGRSIRPQLLAHEEGLELFWEHVDEDQVYTLLHSRWDLGWTTPAIVDEGQKIDAATDVGGILHATYFQDDRPTHAMLLPSGWEAGDDIPMDHPFVTLFRMRLLGTAQGVELALSSSPGDTSYDMRVFRWTEEAGWDYSTLYQSFGLSSDDNHGAVDSRGEALWVWTEQDDVNPDIIGVAQLRDGEPALTWVAREPGFSIQPVMDIQPDDAAVVAWISTDETLAVDREPYGEERVDIDGFEISWPDLAVDEDGVVHLVWIDYEADSGAQQVFYTSNRE